MFNDFVTITKRDYPPKPLKKEGVKELNDKYKWKYIEYKDPVAEAFKSYVCLEPCDVQYAEELDTYYGKAMKNENYPGFQFFMKDEPVNKDVIKKDKIFDGRSEYQVIYCDLATEVADKEFRKKNAVHLPNDIYVPLTTQKFVYRNPGSINSSAYNRTLPIKTENNLDPNYKIRKILKVTTGDSEYMGVIGKLGDRIAVEQLHGNCPPI